MRNQQQDALEVLQRLLQPHTGLQIQMVGGLQQQAAIVRTAEGGAAGLQLSQQLRAAQQSCHCQHSIKAVQQMQPAAVAGAAAMQAMLRQPKISDTQDVNTACPDRCCSSLLPERACSNVPSAGSGGPPDAPPLSYIPVLRDASHASQRAVCSLRVVREATLATGCLWKELGRG